MKRVFSILPLICFIVLVLSFALFPEVLLANDKEVKDIIDSLKTTITAIFAAIVVICFTWAAILYLTSSGDPEKMTKAKKAFLYGVIGVAIGVLAGTAEFAIKKALGLN